MQSKLYSRNLVLASLLSEKDDRGLSPQDSHALGTIYRHKGSLEAVWRAYVPSIGKLPPAARAILTLGCYELKCADRSQAYATVSACVDLASTHARHQKGLVNAVLRKVAGEETPFNILSEQNFPEWLRKKWKKPRLESLLQPPLFACGVDSFELTHHVSDYLEQCQRNKEWPRIQSLSSRFVVEQLKQVIEKLCQSSQTISVWDMCAGKGGKILPLLSLCERFQGKINIVVSDTSEQQLSLLQQALTLDYFKSSKKYIEIVKHEDSDTSRLFDLILLDAPCTGSGTWSKNPRGKWACTPETREHFQKVQRELLRKAFLKLKPGGILFYCVCSLFEEEGTEQISYFLKNTSSTVKGMINKRTLDTPMLTQWNATYQMDGNGVLIEPGQGFEGFYYAEVTLGDAKA